MVTLKELNILQTELDKTFDILISPRVYVLGLDEEKEEEQNRIADSFSDERF